MSRHQTQIIALTGDQFVTQFGNVDTATALCGFTPQVDTNAVLTLVSYLRPRRLLEIGTAAGHMTANLSAWSPADAMVFSIGVVAEDSPHPGSPRQAYEVPPRTAFGRFSNHFGSAHKVFFVTGDSRSYDFSRFAPLDFVFVDGGHDLATARSDSVNSYNALRPGGCLVWHDFGSEVEWVEVRRAIETLNFREPVHHVLGTQVAFLFKAKSPPPGAKVRLSANECSRDEIANGADRAISTPVRFINDLRHFEKKVYSQNGEDGILEEIFRRISATNKFFVEFGVESGIQCNCTRLILEMGWCGLFMEGDDKLFNQLRTRYAQKEQVHCQQALVTSANIEELLHQHSVPKEFDLLSIDVDGNDYWIWKAIFRWSPRVVVIEYNASQPPGTFWVMRENPNHCWDGTTYYGASLSSLAKLGKEKGYTLVGTNSNGVNAFFVRTDIVDANANSFIVADESYHFSPPAYGPYKGGHRPGTGPFVRI